MALWGLLPYWCAAAGNFCWDSGANNLIGRLFRERALRRSGRQEPLDDRLQVSAPHEWLIVAGLGVALLALIIFAVFGRVERVRSYEAALVLPGERYHLISPDSGVVLEVLASEGDSVTSGQPIASLRTSATTQHWEPVIAGVIDVLEERGQLTDASHGELLQVLLAARRDAESTLETAIISQNAGEVVTLDLSPGSVVSAGDPVGLVRSHAPGQPEVVAFVSPEDAATIRVGMDAQVNVGSLGGADVQIFPGQVSEVSVLPDKPPKWLMEKGLPIPEHPHRLRVALLEDSHDIPMADGSEVALRIVLGRDSLVSLVASGSGGR